MAQSPLFPYLTAGKDPSHLGFADPFGSALLPFLQAAQEAGHGINIYSGYRSPEHQKRLWQNALKKYGSPSAARKWVAPPGRSQHNKGGAADLRYSSDAAKKWAHENAARYGLNFRMAHEPWHIELASGKPNWPATVNTSGFQGSGLTVPDKPRINPVRNVQESIGNFKGNLGKLGSLFGLVPASPPQGGGQGSPQLPQGRPISTPAEALMAAESRGLSPDMANRVAPGLMGTSFRPPNAAMAPAGTPRPRPSLPPEAMGPPMAPPQAGGLGAKIPKPRPVMPKPMARPQLPSFFKMLFGG
jgi:hypothetical protein